MIVLGMHRSGTNAIGRWLLRQSPLKDKPLNYIDNTDWIEYSNLSKESGSPTRYYYYYISQINHPDHNNFTKYRSDYANTVYTIERETVEYTEKFLYKYGMNNHTQILVVRSFKNWLASACKMQGNFAISSVDIDKYQSHLYAVKECKWFPIIFDMWHVSQPYRLAVAKALGLQFTDCGKNDVSPNGGGSSFNGMQFDHKACNMMVNTRWKEFKNDPRFQKLLDVYEATDLISATVVEGLQCYTKSSSSEEADT